MSKIDVKQPVVAVYSDGSEHPARIICTDRKNLFSIVALVSDPSGVETMFACDEYGKPGAGTWHLRNKSLKVRVLVALVDTPWGPRPLTRTLPDSTTARSLVRSLEERGSKPIGWTETEVTVGECG